MKLKYNDDGHLIVKDGMPVYDDNGIDKPVDVNGLYNELHTVNEESKNRKLKLRSLNKRYAIFDSIEGFQHMVDKNEAITNFIANADRNQHILDNLEPGVVESYEIQKLEEYNEVIIAGDIETQSLKDQVKSKDDFLHSHLIGQRFLTSKYFSGDNPLTVLPASIALAEFGDIFKIETTDKGVSYAACYIDGKQVMENNKPASFDKCIATLLDRHPNSSHIMLASRNSGSGSRPNMEPGDTPESKLQRDYNDCRSKQDFVGMIHLKSKMFEKQEKRRRR